MKAKLVIGISFVVVFIATFILYLFVANVVAPRLDLSSTANQDIELSPEIKVNKDPNENYSNVTNNQLNSFNMEGKDNFDGVNAPGESYSVVTNDDEPSEVVNEAADEIENTEETASVESDQNTENVQQPKLEPIQPPAATPAPAPEVNLPKLDRPQEEKKDSINRVFVGSYDNVDQAKQAYDKVIESGVDVAPIVKQVDGKYSLQMGAFSDKQKAKDLADKLKQQNLSAKVKTE